MVISSPTHTRCNHLGLMTQGPKNSPLPHPIDYLPCLKGNSTESHHLMTVSVIKEEFVPLFVYGYFSQTIVFFCLLDYFLHDCREKKECMVHNIFSVLGKNNFTYQQ